MAISHANGNTILQTFDRTQELYRLGQVNSIAFRTAQQNYLNAENAYNAARYAAKLSEIVLLKTVGQLVK